MSEDPWIGEAASGLLLGSLSSEKDADGRATDSRRNVYIVAPSISTFMGSRGVMSEIAWE